MSLADEFDAITSKGPKRPKRVPAQQADATRAPSGMTQKLDADVKRKMMVLSTEAGSDSAPFPTQASKVASVRSTAFWGRTGLGDDPTRQDMQRDDNVKKVGQSLDATTDKLKASVRSDAARRNK